jgi:hypothetical protein
VFGKVNHAFIIDSSRRILYHFDAVIAAFISLNC